MYQLDTNQNVWFGYIQKKDFDFRMGKQ